MNKDFFELNDELENNKPQILAEQNAREELQELIELVEERVSEESDCCGKYSSMQEMEVCPDCLDHCSFTRGEELDELLERAKLTAEKNPLSESAVEITKELQEYV